MTLLARNSNYLIPMPIGTKFQLINDLNLEFGFFCIGIFIHVPND